MALVNLTRRGSEISFIQVYFSSPSPDDKSVSGNGVKELMPVNILAQEMK